MRVLNYNYVGDLGNDAFYACPESRKSCRCGEIGRRKGLKIPRWQHRTGSSPVTGTRMPLLARTEALINE